VTTWVAFLWGVGLAYGFAIAAAAYLLKEAFGEPLYEAFLEWQERRLPPDPIEARLARPQENIRSETFVISDLHIDTWYKVPLISGKTREQHFGEFLDTILGSALELYVNGDLVDMPPNPREEWTTPDGSHTLRESLLPKYAPIFAKLADFNAGAQPTMTMYMAGNHDMAASGVRWLLHHLYDLLPGAKLPFQSVWYGNFVISLPYTEDPPQAKFRFLMEHGHYHDPVLVLYLLQFVIGVVSSNLKAAMDSLTVGGQRRSSIHSLPPAPGIVVNPLPTGEPFSHRIVKWRWRWKARRQLGFMNRRFIQAGQQPIDGILMGHTHLPDFYVYRQGEVHGKVYVNTGDWSGDTGHATYAVITDDGLVYLYDWHRNRAPQHSRRYSAHHSQSPAS
jgi:UDP-2,3-diacylglucosamine pyrophosphatase LpxH